MSGEAHVVTGKEMRLVVTASALGTMFEWYDFFIYGTLATSGIIGRTFVPADDKVIQNLIVWAGFAVGFGFRPLGAVLFGYLGDRLGRKYTFLVTITLMGLATAGVGFVPSYAAIGLAAPALVVLLRVAQGLALGGEYGGAAIYVAEHAPPGRSGFTTSFIQASVVGGFVLSLGVVLATKGTQSAATWNDWGWRIPFVFSLALLAVSLWMRLKLSESPVFRAMRAAGETSRNPFVESFTYPGNIRRILVALFGISAGMTVIWYTALFSVLSFLQGPLHLDETAAQLISAVAALVGLLFFIGFGALSDRWGRKRIIVAGYALTLVLVFPLFHAIGVAVGPAPPPTGPKIIPDAMTVAKLLLPMLGLMALGGMAYGPLAALLVEMFPPRIRYSSMSIPYHIGTGYFGGFLPLISAYIVSRTADPYSGLWYTWGVVAMALLVTAFGLKEPPRS